MKNLEQIRASNALKTADDPRKDFKGKKGGENIINEIPPMILNHGFLATAAYGFDNNGWRSAFDAIAEHLADSRIGLLPKEAIDLDKMVKFLTRTESTSEELKLVTSESMAWLNYARRFIKGGSTPKS